MKYEKSKAAVELFDNSDVITSSGSCGSSQQKYITECNKSYTFIEEKPDSGCDFQPGAGM